MKESIDNLDRIRAGWAQGHGRVHFMGVCGVGMAGLACLAQGRGFAVDGCDTAPNRMASWLEAQGIAVRAGHGGEHVEADVEWMVRSTAVPEDHAEVGRAREQGVPVFARGAVLAGLLPQYVSAAVCGTHGKTSTTFFLVQILQSLGLDPSWCVGGELVFPGTPGRRLGPAGVGQGPHLVVEADESDGTLSLYAPDVTVLTNIEFDHREHFADLAAFEECFRTVIRRTRRRLVYSTADARARQLGADSAHGLSFGFDDAAALQAVAVRRDGAGQRFQLQWNGKALAEARVPMPGEHNVLNALGAVAAALALGCDPEAVAKALGGLRLPRRRFQQVVDRNGVRVVSDYAHHPTEVAALIRMVEPGRRVRVVFQPHRYSRTLTLADQFPAAFRGAQEVVLLPVYAASEAPVRGGTHWDLYAHMRAAQEDMGAACQVRLAGSIEQAWSYVRDTLAAGDTWLVVGAGDVENIAQCAKEVWGEGAHSPRNPDQPGAAASLGARLEREAGLKVSSIQVDEPLAGKTTLKVGGQADVYVRAGSEEELARLLGWLHAEGVAWRALGAGSNVLVDDLGVAGVVVRLAASGFGRLEAHAAEPGRPAHVVCGAAVPLVRLLRWCEARGLAGLEFLEGIPGTTGGALRMNAGVPGADIGRHVLWIRFLNSDGSEGRVRGCDLDCAYRSCPALNGTIVLEAALTVSDAGPAAIRRRREGFARKRAWQKGRRTAGSVFKNPADDSAGRLLDAAGLKGRTVGGARILTEHANVIETRPGATASDVRALIELARAESLSRCGVHLETELALWERT